MKRPKQMLCVCVCFMLGGHPLVAVATCMIASYIVLTLEVLAVTIEDPFIIDRSVLPMESYCNLIATIVSDCAWRNTELQQHGMPHPHIHPATVIPNPHKTNAPDHGQPHLHVYAGSPNMQILNKHGKE